MRAHRFLPAVLAVSILGPAPSARGWTPEMQKVIAEEAAWLAPQDLYRQIDRHRDWFLRGVQAPFESGGPERHVKNLDGSGLLDRMIEVEIETAVEAIRNHQPFEQIVYRLGVVSHFVADANNPLNVANADPREPEYFADYLYYMQEVEPRLPLVFYGLTPGATPGRDGSVRSLVDQAFARGRRFYPSIGREYQRIGFASGRGRFDDKSTAFGVAAVSFSQAVTDVVQALRSVWIESGGSDTRALPEKGELVVLLPRYDPERHAPPPALPELPLAPPPPLPAPSR